MELFERVEIKVRSTLDGGLEPSLFYEADTSDGPRPLIVGLHTWSFDRFNQEKVMLPYAKKYNYHLLLPEFRGPNITENPRRKEACASPLAVQDIFDAVEYVKANYEVDEKRIYLIGCSGGGHMSLMCAAKRPDYFRSVASFVPITDLARWETENPNYGGSVRACCGSHEDMMLRSPMSYADSIAKANLKIFHGKYDQVVSYKQSVDLFLEIMKVDPAARVFLDIFDGGHQMSMSVAMEWLLSSDTEAKLTKVSG